VSEGVGDREALVERVILRDEANAWQDFFRLLNGIEPADAH
jgi:hypothetical protein